jgi:uncharacterized protein YjiS (DUF1127 family)
MIAIFLSGAAAEAWKSYADAFAGWTVRLIKAWRYQADIHKLQGMSDRQLRDIGIGRSQIEEAVRGEMPSKGQPVGRLRTLLHP